MTVSTNNYQIGQSAVPSQNFHLTTPAIPDGSLKLYRGNVGTPIGPALIDIDATGNVNIPALRKPILVVALVGAPQAISNGVATVINFDTVSADSDAWWNNTTKRYTPQLAGWYRVTARIRTSATNISDGTSIINKNGAAVAEGTGINGTSANIIYTMVSALVFCNGTTDYLQAAIYCAAGSGNTVLNSGVQTYMNIEYVHP